MSDTDAAVARLVRSIAPLERAVVAFSGGVDSSVVAALAWRALGERALAVTAVSPSLASGELEAARAVAAAIGIPHRTVRSNELARPEYRANARDRCYHCKSELYDILAAVAAAAGDASVLSGANADDQGDWRPGMRAADEHGVRSPLLEAGIGKQTVRAIARDLGVLSADKPASPCLASRIPYGTRVTPQALERIDHAEAALKRLGYRVLRVRHYGPLGRVELAADELPRALTAPGRQAIEQALSAAGYHRVRISTAPFRSGSLNRPPGRDSGT